MRPKRKRRVGKRDSLGMRCRRGEGRGALAVLDEKGSTPARCAPTTRRYPVFGAGQLCWAHGGGVSTHHVWNRNGRFAVGMGETGSQLGAAGPRSLVGVRWLCLRLHKFAAYVLKNTSVFFSLRPIVSGSYASNCFACSDYKGRLWKGEGEKKGWLLNWEQW